VPSFIFSLSASSFQKVESQKKARKAVAAAQYSPNSSSLPPWNPGGGGGF
jgi:hypothetical protein